MYSIYMIRCDDQSLYTGISNNVNQRMRQHVLKLKEAAAYTKSRNVIKLEALWQVENRSQASKIEYAIKQLSKKEKEALIQKETDFMYAKRQPIQDPYFKKIKKEKHIKN